MSDSPPPSDRPSRATGSHAAPPVEPEAADAPPGPVIEELSLFDPGRDLTPDGGTSRFGTPGRPFKANNPFVMGFLAALGVAVAAGLILMVSQLTTVIVYLVISVFLALGLEPLVEWLQRRGVKRGPAIAIVVVAVLGLLVGLFAIVIPIVATQASALVRQLPGLVGQVRGTTWFQDLDARFEVVDTVTTEVQSRLTDQSFMTSIFGGLLGVGQAIIGGIVGTGIVVVLTLYFLATLGTIRHTLYRLAPASRRRRVELLGDEISRRIGGYITGQVLIATLNAVCSYVMMLIVGVPFPAVLALVVGFLGLLPLVGATLGAVIVALVALFSSPGDALVVVIYYLIYQQVENYVLAPRVMKRTVSVPGAVTVIAALAGGTLFGVLGALVAIPTAAAVLLIMNEVLVPRQDRN